MPPTLAQIRQQHPEYHDLSDQQLAVALHRKFYADMPVADFNKRLGYAPMVGKVGVTAQQADAGAYPNPIRHPMAYLESTFGNDVAGADQQVADDFKQGRTLRLPARAPHSFSEGALDVGDVLSQLAMGGAIPHDTIMAALSPVGGAIHAGVTRPLAMGAHALFPGYSVGNAESDLNLLGLLAGAKGGFGAAGEAGAAGAAGEAGLAGEAGAARAPAAVVGAPSVADLLAAARRAPKSLRPTAQRIASAINLDDGTSLGDIRAKVNQGVLPAAASPGLNQLAETVATQPGAGQVALRNAAQARMATQTDRAMGAVQQHLGVDPLTARGGAAALLKAGQEGVKPLYAEIDARPGPVWNPDLAQIAQRPIMKAAINRVATNMLDVGENPMAAGFRLDPDTGLYAMPEDAGPGAQVLPKDDPNASLQDVLASTENQPTAKTWVRVHQALGQGLERNNFTNRILPYTLGDGSVNARSAAATAHLTDILAGGENPAIPGYADVLAKAGDYLSTNSAFNRFSGRLFTGTPYDFNDAWKSLQTPAERTAARAALANDVLEASDRGKFEPGLFKTSGVRQKLAIAFGDDPASGFTDQMDSDTNEQGSYRRILEGSPTARRDALATQYASDFAPKGIAAIVPKIMGATDTIASFTHLPTAITRTMKMATDRAVGGAGGGAAMPDPATTAQLGGVLSDPAAFSSLLDQLQRPRLSPVQRLQGLLSGPPPAPTPPGVLGPPSP